MAPISKDPNDYVRDEPLVTPPSLGEPRSQEPVELSPPWWNRYPWMVSATVVVLVAAGLIDHAYDAEHYILLAIPAGWIGTSYADRRWPLRHTSRTTPSWPATAFAVLGIVVGLILLATLSGHARMVGLYVSVAVGWWGGDLLDWLLVRQDRGERVRGPACMAEVWPRSGDETPEGRRSSRLRRAKAVVAIIGALALILLVSIGTRGQWFSHERELRRFVGEVARCQDTSVELFEYRPGGGSRAVRGAKVSCEDFPNDAKPFVEHVPYETVAGMRQDMLADPPSEPVCLADTDVYFDSLEGRRQFPALCDRLGGHVVDAVTRLPAVADDGTMDSMDAAFVTRQRRDLRAQKRALQRYWGVPVG